MSLLLTGSLLLAACGLFCVQVMVCLISAATCLLLDFELCKTFSPIYYWTLDYVKAFHLFTICIHSTLFCVCNFERLSTLAKLA